ncbi:decaprenyl-phosphate phosphoribosyltransferase [Patescibacteria group bacterium]
MIGTLYQLVRTARPRQWLKNFSLFAAPLFAGVLFKPEILFISLKAFIAFCAISSAAYFINDIIDAPKDRLHPIKKNRPIASGKLKEKTAWITAFFLVFGSIVFSIYSIGTFYAFALISYILIQFAYTLYLKNIIILDSLTIATLFVIRVFAGGFATETSVSSWMTLAVIGLSLLLAFGKRRSEKTLVAGYMGEETGKTRATLKHYPDNLLDSMISMSATYAIITYSLFVFFISPESFSRTLMPFIPSIIRSPKWMMLSIPMVIYSVARYLYVIYEKHEGESPARVLLSDYPLLISVVLWGMFIVGVLYLMPLVFG